MPFPTGFPVGCGQPEKAAKIGNAPLRQSSFDRPLISNVSEPVGQVSTHRPQRVQSGPININLSIDRLLLRK